MALFAIKTLAMLLRARIVLPISQLPIQDGAILISRIASKKWGDGNVPNPGGRRF